MSNIVQIASRSLIDTSARPPVHTATPNSNSPTSSIPLTSKYPLYSPSIPAIAPTSLDELQSSHSNIPKPHSFHSSSSISNMLVSLRESNSSTSNSISLAPTSKAINELQATLSSLASSSSSTSRTTTSVSQKMQRPHLYVQILTLATIVVYHKVFIQY